MNKEEVKDALSIHRLRWDEFDEWIRGSTVGVCDDGSFDYYERDVETFINWKVYGKPYSWD